MSHPPSFTVLDRVAHASLSFDDRGDFRGSTASSVAVVISGAELPAACSEFPCVFTRPPDGRWQISALMGLASGANLFLDAEGRWTADHVPTALRAWPFRIHADPDEPGRLHLVVQLDALNDAGRGERLFDGERQNTPWLEQRIRLLVQAELDLRQTAELLALFDEAGLLRERSLQVVLADGEATTVDGFHVIDEERLGALDAQALARLHARGGLAVAYAHLLSLRHFQRLARRAAKG